MAGKRRYSPRKTGLIVDTAHILIGVGVIVLSCFAVFRPQKYMMLFPVIFLLTAVLDLLTAWYRFETVKRRNGKIAAFIYLFAGLIFLALFVISAVSVRNV